LLELWEILDYLDLQELIVLSVRGDLLEPTELLVSLESLVRVVRMDLMVTLVLLVNWVNQVLLAPQVLVAQRVPLDSSGQLV